MAPGRLHVCLFVSRPAWTQIISVILVDNNNWIFFDLLCVCASQLDKLRQRRVETFLGLGFLFQCTGDFWTAEESDSPSGVHRLLPAIVLSGTSRDSDREGTLAGGEEPLSRAERPENRKRKCISGEEVGRGSQQGSRGPEP